jgi:hypothetical protein
MFPCRNLVAVLSILSFSQLLTQASPVERQEQDLQRRDDVGACELVLLLLKATPFCSSFNVVRDTTRTIAVTGSSKTSTITAPAAACTTTLPGTVT